MLHNGNPLSTSRCEHGTLSCFFFRFIRRGLSYTKRLMSAGAKYRARDAESWSRILDSVRSLGPKSKRCFTCSRWVRLWNVDVGHFFLQSRSMTQRFGSCYVVAIVVNSSSGVLLMIRTQHLSWLVEAWSRNWHQVWFIMGDRLSLIDNFGWYYIYIYIPLFVCYIILYHKLSTICGFPTMGLPLNHSF